MKRKIEIPGAVRFVREPAVLTDEHENVMIRGPVEVNHYMAFLKDTAIEEFWVLTLNTRGRVTGKFMASRGGIASSIVEPRTVFSFAVRMLAASIVCVHNHPSGNPEPSPEDVAVTRQLVEAGRILGIPIRDHVIITNEGYTSLAERGAV